MPSFGSRHAGGVGFGVASPTRRLLGPLPTPGDVYLDGEPEGALVTDPLAAFASSLTTPAPDRSVVAVRRAEVVERLAPTGVWDFFESGSFGHGTALPVHSDVDYMARTDLDRQPTLPSTALRRVKEALQGSVLVRSVRVSSPAVKVEFWSGPKFEVAPAFFHGLSGGGDDVFKIAGPNEEWVLSSPAAHNRWVSGHNDRLGEKAKPLIRLLKAWKYYTGAPVSSTYLELRTAAYLAGENCVVYWVDLERMFSRMISAELAAMNDPLRIVTRIRACSSEENRRSALSMMRSAQASLDRARAAEQAENAHDYWWHMADVFGTGFPYPHW